MDVISKKSGSGDFMFPVKKGLLHKATLKKQPPPKQLSRHEAEVSVDEKGITAEDVQAIQTQIEEIVHKNRLALDLESDNVILRKNELVFPIIINMVVFVISALVILGIAYLVNKEEAAQITRGSAFSSVEGELLQQLRQQAEANISEKDREIEEIRRQLTTLNQDHTTAITKFENQYQEREAEYRDLLEQDIAAEQQRLRTLGGSIEEIHELVVRYEEERSGHYQEELAAYRRQIAMEQEAEDEKYRQLQDQYQSNIKNLNEERQHIQEELRQQEGEMRASHEPRSLHAQQEGTSDLERARIELASLASQRQKIQLEENQITGMFNQVRNALQQEHYNDAVRLSESLIRYLEAITEDAHRRRNLDIYLASSLARIARTELDSALGQSSETDALRARVTSLEKENLRLSQLNQDLSQTSEQAHQREGDLAVLTAHISQNEAEIADLNARIGQLEAESARLTQANQELSITAASQASQNQADTAAFTNRITQLEAESARLTQANQELSITAASQASQNQADTAAFTNRITQLEAESARLTQANQELSITAASQASQNQADTAAFTNRITQLERENARLSRLNQDLSQSMANSTNRIAQLERENARLTQANQELSKTAASQASRNQADTAAFTNRITQLEAENARLTQANQELSKTAASQASQSQADTAALTNRLTQLERENTRLTQTNQELSKTAASQVSRNQTDTAALTNRLTQLEAENARLTQANQELSKTATSQVSRNQTDTAALTNRIAQLEAENTRLTQTNQELSITAASQAPQTQNADTAALTNRITQLESLPDEREIQERFLAAHKEGIVNVMNILEVSLRIKNPEIRNKYLGSMKPRYSDDPNIIAFINLLIKRL